MRLTRRLVCNRLCGWSAADSGTSTRTTAISCTKLTDGILFSKKTCYEIYCLDGFLAVDRAQDVHRAQLPIFQIGYIHS